MSKTIRADPTQARNAILAAQGLTAARGGASLVETIEQTGWVRTLGGVDVYLAVRARVPHLTRADLDSAVERGDLKVIPAARGCIYLVPRSQAAAALRLAAQLRAKSDAREQEKAGIRPGELEAVGEAVLAALAGGPLTTTALRAALPDALLRSLGEAGKKVGITSPLPPALRRLEFAGRIERTLEGGRLDTERYLWRRTQEDPFAEAPEGAALHRQVAEIFFRAAGLATVKAFAGWAGFSQRDAKAALEGLDLLTVDLEGQGEFLALAEYRTLLEDPPASGLAFLPFEDNLTALHGGPAFFVDPAYHGIPVPVWGRGKGTTLGDARHSSLRSVMVGGRLRGFWEYDPDGGEVVFACYDPVSPAQQRALAEEAGHVAAFLRDDVGHGRSFSIDTEKDLRRRCEQIRGMG